MGDRARTYARRAALALAGSTYVCAAQPASIRSLDITLADGRYHVVADTYLAAPPDDVYEVLLDYDDDAYGRISDVYKESEYLPPDKDGAPLVFTRVEGCLLFFCRSMRRVERLETVEPTFIRATTLPERSDFKYSVSRMTLEPEGRGTKVVYELDMEPDFWLPPFVGPAFLKRVLIHGGTHAVQRIEALAQHSAARRSPESGAPKADDAVSGTAAADAR